MMRQLWSSRHGPPRQISFLISSRRMSGYLFAMMGETTRLIRSSTDYEASSSDILEALSTYWLTTKYSSLSNSYSVCTMTS